MRGAEGYGAHRRLHAERFPDVSAGLPLLGMAVGPRERILAALGDVDATVARGLVTLEPATLATGGDVPRAEFPPGPGRAAKLTVYCRGGERAGGGPAYREVVALLRRTGATGAIVLRGVDGVIGGRRARARLFGADRGHPGGDRLRGPRSLLRRCLPHLGDVLADPVVTLEPIAQLKHDGERLEPPPAPAAGRHRTRGRPSGSTRAGPRTSTAIRSTAS